MQTSPCCTNKEILSRTTFVVFPKASLGENFGTAVRHPLKHSGMGAVQGMCCSRASPLPSLTTLWAVAAGSGPSGKTKLAMSSHHFMTTKDIITLLKEWQKAASFTGAFIRCFVFPLEVFGLLQKSDISSGKY